MNLWDKAKALFRAPDELRTLHETAVKLREIAGQEVDNNELLTERLAELELALEDIQWVRLANETERELSRNGLQRIMAMSRWMFLKNPLINRAVTLQAFYVWAQGVEVKANDDKVDQFVQAFMADKGNRREFFGHQARSLKEMELQITGNLYFVFFTDTIQTGRSNMRSIPADEIQDIITDPDDRKCPRYYRRQWVSYKLAMDSGQQLQAAQTAWYPDVNWDPGPDSVDAEGTPLRPMTIGGWPVKWESPVYHLKVGGLADMRFGVPETYAALDWARAYKEFLEDWATIVRSYARFSWKLAVKGGKQAVAAAKSRLGTTLAQTTPINADTNPPAVAGSSWIQSEGADLTPIKTSGATTSADDGRQMKLMVASASGMPETFFGDADVGNHATSQTLDRPTELKFVDRQKLWTDALQDIVTFICGRAADTGALAEDCDTTITVTWPPILEHDIWETMQSIVAANGTGRLDKETVTRQICSALGITDVDAVLEALEEEDAEEEAKAAANPAPPAPNPASGAGDNQNAKQEGLREVVAAIRGLRESLLLAA